MASMAGVMNTFSTQASMAAPSNRDGTAVNTGKRDAYTVTRAVQTETERFFCAPLASRSFLPGRPGWVFGIEGSSCKSTPHPAYGSELSTGGGRLVRALIGNGVGAPPVSRFLYRPAL